MNTPSLAAEQLQWASRLDHINTAQTYFGIGAVVMSQKALDDIKSADDREILRTTGKQAADALTKRIPQRRRRLVRSAQEEDDRPRSDRRRKGEWKAVFKKACQSLKELDPRRRAGQIGAC